MVRWRTQMALGAAAFLAVALGAIAQSPKPPEIRTSDVDLFYRIYDASHGKPTAETLDRDYIQGGSDGVRQFVPDRIRSGDALAADDRSSCICAPATGDAMVSPTPLAAPWRREEARADLAS